GYSRWGGRSPRATVTISADTAIRNRPDGIVHALPPDILYRRLRRIEPGPGPYNKGYIALARAARYSPDVITDVARNPSPEVVIRPSKGWVALGLKELWQYRELFYFLVWRDVKIRYKQTALGAAWAIIQPFFTMIVFSV